MRRRSGIGILSVLGTSLILAACSGGTGTASTGGGTALPGAGTIATSPPGGGSVATPAGGGAGSGGDGFEGSLTSSGIYAATWAVASGSDPNPFNAAANPSLTSDKGTFANIVVKPDGTIKLGSAASELNANSSYDGTGAKVTIDGTGQFVCAFTVDNDLKGNHDGAILHLAGGLTVHWHAPGDLTCP